MRVIAYGLLALLLMSGCVRRVRHIPVEVAPAAAPTAHKKSTTAAKAHQTKVRGRLYNTSQTEAKYNLKPEPFSVGSQETDPELLGPQSTADKVEIAHIEPTLTTKPIVQTEPTPQPVAVAPVTTPSVSPTSSVATSMSRSECISMIGDAKFQRYSKRFGGEAGAIKRCAILKKLKRG